MRYLHYLCLSVLVGCVPSQTTGYDTTGKPSIGMTTPLTPSTTPTFPASITVPNNGDPLDASQLQTDVEVPLQNGVEAARLLTYGGGVRWRVKCSSNTVLNVYPLGGVVATVAGVWTTKALTTTSTINPSALAGALAADTRYYVYVSIVAGVITFSVSTTAPDAGLFYKTGDTSAMFVSTFITDDVPNILRYSQSNREYIYSDYTSTLASHGNQVAAGISGAASGTVSLALPCPAFAISCTMRADITWAGDGLVSFLDTSTAIPTFQTNMHTSAISSQFFFPFSTANANTIDYNLAANTTLGQLSVAGFIL